MIRNSGEPLKLNYNSERVDEKNQKKFRKMFQSKDNNIRHLGANRRWCDSPIWGIPFQIDLPVTLDLLDLALQETDTTDCSCMELYSRNKYHPTARSSTVRSHQSHPRINSCARCRKRKPGNPKNPQHCPSCLCPPDVIRSSSGTLRGAENMEEVLARFEEITTHEVREPGPAPSSNSKPTAAHGRNAPIRSHPKKSSSLNRQRGKSEHDQMLNALYHDLMSSGLAPDATQGCSSYQAPIKSVRKKPNPPPPAGDQEAVDIDSDAVLRYFRDYKNPKAPEPNILTQKQENARGEDLGGTSRPPPRLQNDIEEDERCRHFERDRRELNELGQEVREFQMKKGREKCDGDEHWEKRQKTRPSDDGDQMKRKVSFLPSKLPVPMYGNQSSTRSRSPAGDHIDKCISIGKVEARINCHSSKPDNNGDDEDYRRNHHHFDYPKESRDSLAQDLKDIPYCDVPYRSLSAETSHTNKSDEQNVVGVSELNMPQDHCGELPPEASSKKYAHGGAGDLDLHASKSYIVDLIDRALSRELGTAPEERKDETVARPSRSQKEICVEIARALRGDCCLTYESNCTGQKDAPDYVRHLKVLRWDYLNHIQEELKKLQDLERILDTYSPRQSLSVLQSQASSPEQKINHHTIL